MIKVKWVLKRSENFLMEIGSEKVLQYCNIALWSEARTTQTEKGKHCTKVFKKT